MAKARRKEKPAPAGSGLPEGKSALELAMRALELGDVVAARRAARAVTPGPATPASQKVAQLLLGTGKPATPEELAQEILRRTAPPARVYVFGAVALLVMTLLVILAIARL